MPLVARFTGIIQIGWYTYRGTVLTYSPRRYAVTINLWRNVIIVIAITSLANYVSPACDVIHKVILSEEITPTKKVREIERVWIAFDLILGCDNVTLVIFLLRGIVDINVILSFLTVNWQSMNNKGISPFSGIWHKHRRCILSWHSISNKERHLCRFVTKAIEDRTTLVSVLAMVHLML